MLARVKKWIERRMPLAPGLFGDSYWYEPGFWEPTVQLVLRDLCWPGRVVFDVGANMGGLTTVMSRMVGPRGVVCAFEASPRIVDKCQRNVVMQGCANVQVFHAAVFRRSNETVALYPGDHLNDSIYDGRDSGKAAFTVPTLALDDFVRHTGLEPDLIKMDIEGAEFDALEGALQTIKRAKPHLILETQPRDSRCLELLMTQGYTAIDLNTYREIRSAKDYPPGTTVRNNLYVHHERLSETPYRPPFSFIETAKMAGSEFAPAADGSLSLRKSLTLGPGRYLLDMDFEAQGTGNEMMCGIKLDDKVVFRYHSYTKFLAESYRDWVIHVPRSCALTPYFHFLKETADETFQVKGGRIIRVAEFDKVPPPLYI